MSNPPIYKSRIYVFREHPGISGFQQWDRYDYGIASGAVVRSRGLETMFSGGPNLNACRFVTRGEGYFDHLPSMSFAEACDLITAGKIRAAFVLEGGDDAQ